MMVMVMMVMVMMVMMMVVIASSTLMMVNSMADCSTRCAPSPSVAVLITVS